MSRHNPAADYRLPGGMDPRLHIKRVTMEGWAVITDPLLEEEVGYDPARDFIGPMFTVKEDR